MMLPARNCLIAALLTLANVSVTLVYGDDYSPTATLTVALSKPMTSIVDGQSFRAGLGRIANQARVNLCLDRRVDPSRQIEAGPLGPTVFAALQKLADSHDCVLVPVDNVVLVGRADWVDRTLATLLSLKSSSRSSRTLVQWGDLTTPTDALRATGGSPKGFDRLPHDLWPQTKWTAIDPRVAVALVLAQFDVRPQFAANGIDFTATKIETQPTKAVRHYFPGGRTDEIAGLIGKYDQQQKTVKVGNRLRITASPTAHRQLVSALLQSNQPAGPDPDKDTFTVRKSIAPAANVLQQLAASAGKKCVIDTSAEQACQAMVTVEGVNVTLKQLVSAIAQQAGVKVEWTSDAIVVTKR